MLWNVVGGCEILWNDLGRLWNTVRCCFQQNYSHFFYFSSFKKTFSSSSSVSSSHHPFVLQLPGSNLKRSACVFAKKI